MKYTKEEYNEALVGLIDMLEPIQESKISRACDLDHGRMRSELNKLMLEGRIIRGYKDKKVIYTTGSGFTNKKQYTIPEIKLMIKVLIDRTPGKNIMYYSDALTMLGIGQGYDSNQKLIRRMGEKGILNLRMKGSNTLCYPNYHFHEFTTTKKEDYKNHTFDYTSNMHTGPSIWSISPQKTSDNGFIIRSDVTIESFVRQMAKLQRRYPDVKKFKLVPVED